MNIIRTGCPVFRTGNLREYNESDNFHSFVSLRCGITAPAGMKAEYLAVVFICVLPLFSSHNSAPTCPITMLHGGVTSGELLTYNREQLVSVHCNPLQLCQSITTDLRQLGFYKRSTARRLHRGGVGCRRRFSAPVNTQPDSNSSNTNTGCRPFDTDPIIQQQWTIRVAYINARSCKNKTSSIQDFIIQHNRDVLIITET